MECVTDLKIPVSRTQYTIHKVQANLDSQMFEKEKNASDVNESMIKEYVR
ncbi:hypothetical protein Glove_79g84 [Diversispora epigaea]|uniref:Uncharacterized protein n=1 Tax=Diversispora epigaea TaxID=1348612 RepID=A0A397JJ99_9GLOM|nr:hypothetical protein Glove_79g84 [Diversispora epigaea]